MKYRRQSFRESAKGTQRFSQAAWQPLTRRRMSGPQARRFILLSVPLLAILLLLSSRFHDLSPSPLPDTVEANGAVLSKEIRAVLRAGEQYLLTVRFDAPDGSPTTGEVAVPAERWHEVEVGTPVILRCRSAAGSDEFSIVEVHPSSSDPKPAGEL